MSVLEQSTTIWLPLISGFITLLLTLYGTYRSWLQRRAERQALVGNLARVAVRLTVSSYVRPLLKQRIDEVITEVSRAAPHCCGAVAEEALLWRMRLFCRLQARVGLSLEEKQHARTTAFNFLVEDIRGQSSPPMTLRTDAELNKAKPTLYREIEIAYNLQPRPANGMIMDLAAFASPSAPAQGQGSPDGGPQNPSPYGF